MIQRKLRQIALIQDIGGNFVLRQEVSADAVDFATEIANFKAAGCDVIMVAGMYGTLAPFAVTCNNSDYDVKLVGCSNAYTNNLIEIAGEAAEGIYAPVSFFAGSTDEKIQLFPQVFRFLNEWRFVIYGVLLVVMMQFRPQGALGWQSTLPYKLSRRTRATLKEHGIEPTDAIVIEEKGAQA